MAQQPGVVRVQEALELIGAALRGESVASPATALHGAILEIAVDQGVAPLLLRAPAVGGWPADLVREMRHLATAEAALALVRTRELRRLLDVFQCHDVQPLLLKGEHLSRTCYPSPECRPHGDVDVLIADGDRAQAMSALRDAGYAALPHVTGDVAFTQAPFVRTDENGATHHLDLHWRICGPRVFAERLTWAELRGDSVPIPRLHAMAAGPSDAHALMLACIHRTAHHANSERLIWLYDIHSLAIRLSVKEWEALVTSAIQKGIAPVIFDGLSAARRCLGTKVPRAMLELLSTARGDGAATAFLDPAHTPVKVLLSDWHALRGLGPRLRFLREHLLPSPDYMKQRYRAASSARLPFLYVHRLVTGARRWL